MTPHDTIILRLPFAKRTWYGMQVIKHRAIGFEFTNRLKLELANLHGLEKESDFNALVEKHGQQWVINQSLFCSARAFCITNRLQENFDYDSLMKALALADTSDQEKLMNCWKNSQTFGASFKKKAKEKKKRK